MPRAGAVALIGALIGALAACGSQVPGQAVAAPDMATSAAAQPPAGQSAAPPTAPLAPVGDVPLAPTPNGPAVAEQARQDPQVLEYGFSAYKLQYSPGWITSYAVLVKNPNPNTWVASATYLTVTFRDAAGNVVLTDDLVTLYGLGPGQTSAVAGTDSGGKAPAQATTMDVQITRAQWFNSTQIAPGEVTMSAATVRPSPEDTVTPTAFITCAARSTYRSKISSVYAEIVYRDGAGKIIGGSAHNSDANHDTLTLPGNGTRTIQIKALFVPPTGVPAAVCYPSYVKPL